MVEGILTTAQAAEFLQLSIQSVKARARAGTLPAARIGREWRFSRQQLLDWIEAGGDRYEDLVEEGLIAATEEAMADPDNQQGVRWEETRRQLAG
jgi:excisionase family DNA binding protein